MLDVIVIDDNIKHALITIIIKKMFNLKLNLIDGVKY